jgi:hypothetical protein
MILTKTEELKEYFMFEMQGEIEYCDKLDGIHLGKFEELGQKCKLTIGNHILRGKIEDLPKPLLLIQKQSGNLIATGIIKKKYLFSERPAPIPDFTKQKIKAFGN